MLPVLKYQLHEDNRYYLIVMTDSMGCEWTSENLDRIQKDNMLHQIAVAFPSAERLPDKSDPT